MKSKKGMRMINVFIAFVLLLTGMLGGAKPASAQTGSVVATATPSSGSLNVGEQVIVTINIDMTGVSAPDDALGSFTSALNWDPTILDYVTNTGLPAGFTGVVNTGSVDSGSLTFNGANASGATGDLEVLTITFDVILGGTTTLDLSFSAMAAAITFNSLLGILTVNDGSFTGLGTSYNLTVAVDPVGGGTTTPAVGTHPYNENTVVTVTPQPNSGYQFDSWSGACTGSGFCQVTMDGDKSVTAHFVVAPPLGIVELDGAVSNANGNETTTLSFSHTTGTGLDRLMLVGVSWNCETTNKDIVSVEFSYGTTDLIFDEVITQVVNVTGGSVDGPRYSAIYSYLNPPSGQAGTLTIAFSPAVEHGIVAGAVNFKGVDQTNPLGTPAGASGETTDPSVTLTGLGGTELVFDNAFLGGQDDTYTLSVGADQTQRWNDFNTNTRGTASTEQATGSSVTMSWDASTENWWALAAVPINPAAGVPPVCYALTLTSGANGSAPTAVPTQTSGCDPGYYAAGQLINLTAHPDSGYQVASWSGTNNDSSMALTNQLTMPGEPHAVNVTYELAPVVSEVELDGAVSSGTGNETNSLAISHTTGTGDNRLMMVGISWNCGETAVDIGSVEFTYGATELVFTEVITQEVVVSGTVTGPRYSAIYSYLNPPTGQAGTLTVAFESAVPNGIVAGVVNFKNVNQANPLGTPQGAYDLYEGEVHTAPSLTLTGLGGSELVFDNAFLGGQDDSYTLSVGANQTQHWNAFAGNARGAASTEQATGSSVTMSWDASTENWWAQTAVPINPAPVSGDTYNLTMAVNPTSGGTTTPAVGVHAYDIDTVVDISATAAMGYTFDSWTGDVANPTSASTTVTMDAPKTVTANFIADEYTLTINVTGSGSVAKNPDQATYTYGDIVQLTANPAENWEFAEWGGDLSGETNPETIIMDGNKTVSARFTTGGSPVLPSNFYGEIHFEADDGGPEAGDLIEAYIDDQTSPIASVLIESFGTPPELVYAINVPGYPDGGYPSTVTFKIDGRVVAMADWISGDNIELDIHPPKADADGPYIGSLDDTSVTIAGSGTDWGTDVAGYSWDFDEDGEYDDAAIHNPEFLLTTAGTYTVGLKVQDAQGGEGMDSSLVFALALSGIVDQVYNGSPHPVTVTGVESPYTYAVLYGDPLGDIAPTDPGTYAVRVQIKEGEEVIATYDTEMVIGKATALVTLSNLNQQYDGSPKPVTVTTDPAGLTVVVTYDGAATVPSALGSYAVVATVDDTYYEGSVEGTLVIGISDTINMVAGWNLVSFNVAPTSSAIEDVLASIDGNYSLVYAWDGSAASNQWMKYDPNVPYGNTLTELTEKMGFWIYMNEADTLTVESTSLLTSTSINLSIAGGGWNLIGYPSSSSTDLPGALSEVAGDYTLVLAYHAEDTEDPWKIYDPTAPDWSNDLDAMSPDWGYWIFVESDVTLNVAY